MKVNYIEKAIENNVLPDYVYTYPLKSQYKVFEQTMFYKEYSKHVNIYIHIPFCKNKCAFCDLFSTFSCDENLLLKYVMALINEIKNFYQNDLFNDKVIDSIYFGGGTPTVLPIKLLSEIISTLNSTFVINDNTELSIETTPLDLDFDYISEIKKLGFNRVSVGVQSLNKAELDCISRKYDYTDVLNVFSMLNSVGFTNINADLIYGLPLQTAVSWEDTIQKIINIGSSTVTIYPLVKKNSLQDDNCMDSYQKYLLYDIARSNLFNSKFKQFTFTSFSKHANACKHEESFFSGNSVIGFGLGARNYLNNVHFIKYNVTNKLLYEQMNNYLNCNDKSNKCQIFGKILTECELNNRNALLGLLLSTQGCLIDSVDKEFAFKIINMNLAYRDKEKLYLTLKGMKYSSVIAYYLINYLF